VQVAQALLHFLTDMFLGKLESVDFDYEKCFNIHLWMLI